MIRRTLSILIPAVFAAGAFRNLLAPAAVQTFDDGSSLTTDDVTGAITGIVDSAGRSQPVPPANGSPLIQQFADLFNFGVRAVINAKVTQPAAAQASSTQAAAASASSASVVKVLLIAAAAAFGYKLLKSS